MMPATRRKDGRTERRTVTAAWLTLVVLSVGAGNPARPGGLEGCPYL